MSAKTDQVLREVVAIGFRAYPRSLLNGAAFAILTAAFVWPSLPHAFLLGWLAAFVAIQVARLALSRAFLRAPPPTERLAAWTHYAAVGYGCIGLAWGSLGAAVLHYAPEAPIYIMFIVFLITLFAVLQTQSTGAHRGVFLSYLACAMGPIMIASMVEPSPNPWLRVCAEALLFVVAALVGRAGNRYMVESIQLRFENLELLADLTRQKEALAQANAAKTHFLAAASHDLRQPMQAVVLLVESLQERVAEPETRRIVKSIRSSVASMAALLNAILDVSRFDAGTVKPQRAHFRAADVLNRLRTTYAAQAQQKGLRFTVARSAAILETDPILLFRILANITTNALRYTDSGGVLVGCRRRGGRVAIEVWDTGPGIAADQLGEIFREFYQVANPQRDREQGLGLGLAIVERTAKLLDHPLQARSRVGRGSMFAVVVPRGDARRIEAADKPRRADGASLAGCTVLVVDDERDILAAMTILLESWDCEVLTASTGDEALALVDGGGRTPHVVLADQRLPGALDGIATLLEIRRLQPLTAGILVSGDIAAEVLQRAESAGLRLLHKPLRPAKLRALLASLWRERSPAARKVEEAAAP